ncbi:MAG: endonuclease MutS2 [Ignavibacteriales bacterium]
MQGKMLKILEFDKILSKLADECASTLGVELAKGLVPSYDFSEVSDYLEETSQAVEFIMHKGIPPFQGVRDIRHSVDKAKKSAQLTPGEILAIGITLNASRNLKTYFDKETSNGRNNNGNHCSILLPLFKGLYQNNRIEEKISSCIISEDEISDNASPALSSIRRQIIQLEQDIKDKLNKMIHSSNYQKYLQESFVTIRGGRYVLPVKQEYRNEISGLVHDSSSSGATLFIEPMALVEANNSIKQLRIKESQEIERILYELSALITEISSELSDNIDILAKLDFIFAKGKLSLNMNCAKPFLSRDGTINIINARHPLLSAGKVVPIDIWFDNHYDTLVITGPNTGGKTVTLKTVGLLTLMAQSGLHIPAKDGSKINVFNQIFVDIGDEQSIEQNLSTFSSHMKNIINILNSVEANSLVLLDELGSGTDPVEGAAIATSILEYLHNKNAVTIATTHYSELKLFAIKTEGIENASCEFDVNTLMPTYRLLIGIPGRSNAFAISRKLGLSESILSRAQNFISSEEARFEDVIAVVEKNRLESERALLEIESLKKEAGKLKEDLEKSKAIIDKQKNSIIREAKSEARQILNEAKIEAENALDEIKKLSEEEASERDKKSQSIRMRLKNKLKENEVESDIPLLNMSTGESNHVFNNGDNVYIISLKQKGVALGSADETGNILVQSGAIKIKIPASQLQPISPEKNQNTSKVSTRSILSNKERSVSLELDLRGQTLDEAVANTDAYLDNVYLAGIKNVTIIHGKGTGVLRKGIHEFLKKHPNVKSYRLGVFGEGEQGVTIVELS